MDSSTCKNYRDHGFDSRKNLDMYFSDKPDMVFGDDSLIFPIKNLTKIFKEGLIKGDILINLGAGSVVHYLYGTCDRFKKIIVLKVQDRCILELKRWLNTRTGAFEWGHATEMYAKMGGESEELQDHEGKVRSAVQHVLKCDLEKDNIMEPVVLPPADCIISAWFLEFVCKDQNDFIRYLRKMTKLLKPGGHLIIIALLDMTYITVGKDKIRTFPCNEDFVRNALIGEDCVIDYCNVKERTNVSDFTDYKASLCIAAQKKV